MIIDQILGFKENIDAQNRHHVNDTKNLFFVASFPQPPQILLVPRQWV